MIRLVSGGFRRAMDFSLVLDQEQIQHTLLSVGEEEWALSLDDADAERANAVLAAFETENAPPLLKLEPPLLANGVAAGLIFGLPLLALQIWTGPESNSPWFVRGSLDAALFLQGEWWRAVTALTLHADAGHAVGNALLGGLLLAFLARRLGTGATFLLTLLTGFLGNCCAAELVRRDFVSIGASTAVFAALGALALLPGQRRALQAAAAVALLAFLGTGKRADLAGHLCGFLCGAALGAVVARLPPVLSKVAQALFGALTAAALLTAWAFAFRH